MEGHQIETTGNGNNGVGNRSHCLRSSGNSEIKDEENKKSNASQNSDLGFGVGSLHAYDSSEVKMNMGEYPIQYPKLSDSKMGVIDRMIKQLTAAHTCKVQNEVLESVNLKLEDIALVCKNVHDFFMAEPGLIKLNAPINVVGDIHGQFLDLLRYFEVGGFPPDSSYLFLGDFVDRGNHECISTSRFYGFHDECQKRFNSDTWRHVNAVFRALPIAATIDERIFCTHGGLSPELNSLDDILNIPRPTDLTVEGLLCDLLWSDPSTEIDAWAPSDRGVSWLFGRDVLDAFLKKNNFDLFVRAHQVVEAGFEFFPKDKRQLVTVFSAVNYCGHFDNAGAMLIIDKDMTCSFRVLRPPEHKAKEEEKNNLKRPPTSGNIIRPEAPSVD